MASNVSHPLGCGFRGSCLDYFPPSKGTGAAPHRLSVSRVALAAFLIIARICLAGASALPQVSCFANVGICLRCQDAHLREPSLCLVPRRKTALTWKLAPDSPTRKAAWATTLRRLFQPSSRLAAAKSACWTATMWATVLR